MSRLARVLHASRAIACVALGVELAAIALLTTSTHIAFITATLASAVLALVTCYAAYEGFDTYLRRHRS